MVILPLWLLSILVRLKQTKRKCVLNASVSCLFHSRKLRGLEEWTSCNQIPFQNVNITLVTLSNLVVEIEFNIIAVRKLCILCNPRTHQDCRYMVAGRILRLKKASSRKRLVCAKAVRVHVATCGKKHIFGELYLRMWNGPAKTTDAQNPPFPGFFFKRHAPPAQTWVLFTELNGFTR